MNRMSIACTPPKLGSQWGLRYLSPQTTGQHCLSVELIAHPDDLCIKREISKAVSYIHLNSNRLLQHIWGPCYFLLSSKKTRENLRIFSNRPVSDKRQKIQCYIKSQYSLCIPSHEKISSDGHYVCTLYFQERTGNIYHHCITITIVTAIDGVEVTKLTQLCQFILWFSLILLTLKCTSIYLSQYRNSLDVISSDNPLWPHLLCSLPGVQRSKRLQCIFLYLEPLFSYWDMLQLVLKNSKRVSESDY